MEIKIRLAEYDDRENLLKLKDEAINTQINNNTLQWNLSYPNFDTFTNDIDRKQGYVATYNNEIVAYATLCYGIEDMYRVFYDGYIDNSSDYSTIHRVMVTNKYLNKGLATKLLKYLIDISKYKLIRIDTSDGNYSMKKVIEKLNFKYIAKVDLEDKTSRNVYELIV